MPNLFINPLNTAIMEVTVMPAAAPVQKQQGLNQVVINKVQKMIEGKQQGVMATITRLLEEGKIAQDFIAPIGVNLRNEDRHPVITFQAEEQVQMNMPEGNFNLHGNAISQISEKMGIPAKYLRELSAGDAWQKQIEARIQEVQKESSQGCLFPETDTQPLPQQPPANGTANGNRPDGQMRMFTSQPPQQPVQQAIPQPVQQPVPRPQIVQPQPVPQYYPGTPQPQPMYEGYCRNPANGSPQQTAEQPQTYFRQPGGQYPQAQPWQQPQPVPLQPQATVIQTTRENTGREYQSPPQPAAEALTFDKDDESDRELLREDPYAEYIDFPQECRMKDETQAELICC